MRTSIRLVLAAALAFATLALFACTEKGPSALSINDVRSDPSAYVGEITVTGIMGATAPRDPSIFGVMDKSELTCTSPNCNKYFLPVRYAGGIPQMGDEVVITGQFMPGGQLFAATSVKVLRNHPL